MTAVDELLRDANPVPDPAAAVDEHAQAAALAHALAVSAPPQVRMPVRTGLRNRRPARARARRGVLVAAATAAAIATALAAGELGSAPRQVAVLPALADELTGPGILHAVERTTVLSPTGQPRAGAHTEETWTLLADPTVSRYRITTDGHTEEGTTGDAAERSGARAVDEPPVAKLARDAAAGEIPSSTGPVIDGRPTIRVPADDGAWYIAQDAPELVRRDLRLRSGDLQRSDYTTWEVLPDNPANRGLLRDQDPGDDRVATDAPPSPGS